MKKLLLVLLVMGITSTAFAVGTCTTTDVTSTQNVNSRVPDPETVIVTLTCTADASAGTFPSVTIPLTGYSPQAYLNVYNLTGYILYAVGRTPGTTAPTANYTVTVKDVDGFALDLALLTGNGSHTAAQFTPITSPAPIVRSALTVAITSNIVNSAGLTIDLVFRTRP